VNHDTNVFALDELNPPTGLIVAPPLKSPDVNTPSFHKRPTNLPPLNIVKLGAIVYLLKSVGLLNTRNSIQYSDGGVNINMDKTPAIQAWIQMIQNEYEEKKNKYKISANIENAWGAGVSSEYVLINTQALLDSW
jgi:hypothetical protein